MFRNDTRSRWWMGLLIFFLAHPTVRAQELDAAFASPENLLRALYERISFEPGTTPDWDTVLPLFDARAVLSLRVTREHTERFDRDAFVDLFRSDIERYALAETGFAESIIGMHIEPFGETAWARVVYQAHRLSGERAPQRGVDLFLLVRSESGWRILSIANEVPTAERPIPGSWLDSDGS